MSGPLRIYHVTVAGRKVLFRLNQTDAQRLGAASAVPTEAEQEPVNQAADRAGEKARQPSNKAKTPPNKAQPAT